MTKDYMTVNSRRAQGQVGTQPKDFLESVFSGCVAVTPLCPLLECRRVYTKTVEGASCIELFKVR